MKRLLIKGLLTIIMSTMCMEYSTMSAHGAGAINDNGLSLETLRYMQYLYRKIVKNLKQR